LHDLEADMNRIEVNPICRNWSGKFYTHIMPAEIPNRSKVFRSIYEESLFVFHLNPPWHLLQDTAQEERSRDLSAMICIDFPPMIESILEDMKLIMYESHNVSFDPHKAFATRFARAPWTFLSWSR
jgi:hypothetical protein